MNHRHQLSAVFWIVQPFPFALCFSLFFLSSSFSSSSLSVCVSSRIKGISRQVECLPRHLLRVGQLPFVSFFSFRNAFQFQNLVFITARNESEGVFRFSLGKFESLTSCCCYCCWCYGFERFLTVVVEEAVLGEGEPSLLP
jgi:hypothetical protein